MPVTRALQDVLTERTRQDAKWGGPAHDDTHSMYDWTREIALRVGEARYSLSEHRPPRQDFIRKQLVEIAALALAALESHDRKKP